MFILYRISIIKLMMLTEEQKNKILKHELSYQTSRSGGKGGQNVNKLETKVTITFDIMNSLWLTIQQKNTLLEKRSNLQQASVIQISSSNSRTQLANKQDAQQKLFTLLNKLLKPKIKRVASKPSKSSIERKLKDKKLNSEKKERRKKL